MNIKNNKDLILLIYGILGVAANMAHPVTPTLFNMRNFDTTMFGLAYSMMSFFNFLFSFYWSKQLKKIKINHLFMICCMGYSFAQFLFMSSTDETGILISRGMAGAFMSGIFIGVPYYFVLTSKEDEKAVYITKLSTFFTVGGTVGYFIGGYLGNFNVYYSLVSQVVVLFASGIALFFMVSANTDNKIDINKKMFNTNVKLNTYQLFVLTLTFCLFISSTSLTQMYAYYLINVLKVSPLINGITKGVVGFLSLFVNLFLTLKIQESKKVYHRIEAYLSVLVMFYIGFILKADNYYVFIVIGIVIMVIDTMHLPILQNICIKNTERENQSAVLGYLNGIKSMAMIIGAAVSGYIFKINIVFPFVLSFAFALIALMVTFMFINKQKQIN